VSDRLKNNPSLDVVKKRRFKSLFETFFEISFSDP
jgi:hypothetical protein